MLFSNRKSYNIHFNLQKHRKSKLPNTARLDSMPVIPSFFVECPVMEWCLVAHYPIPLCYALAWLQLSYFLCVLPFSHSFKYFLILVPLLPTSTPGPFSLSSAMLNSSLLLQKWADSSVEWIDVYCCLGKAKQSMCNCLTVSLIP